MQAILVIGVIVLAILVLPLLGAVVGAFCGLIVGAVFDESMTKFLAMLHTDMAPYQLGAMLGFIGGFFKSTVSTK